MADGGWDICEDMEKSLVAKKTSFPSIITQGPFNGGNHNGYIDRGRSKVMEL